MATARTAAANSAATPQSATATGIGPLPPHLETATASPGCGPSSGVSADSTGQHCGLAGGPRRPQGVATTRAPMRRENRIRRAALRPAPSHRQPRQHALLEVGGRAGIAVERRRAAVGLLEHLEEVKAAPRIAVVAGAGGNVGRGAAARAR